MNILDYNALYHITHIDNISTIFKYGLLAHNNKYQIKDISDNQVNSRRNRIEPIYRKNVHSYVPFYFNPKNAMLYKRKEIQDDIIILAFEKSLIELNGAIFTDGNASSCYSTFYKDIVNLNRLDWNCLSDWSWCNHPDGKRTRMAEVLVPSHVSIDRLQSVICNSITTYINLLEVCPSDTEIILEQKFYF
jgi:hypothetical protein